MDRPTPPSPELARLLTRLSTLLDEAESAIAQARPEALAQAAPVWAQLCRELRRTPEGHWPSARMRQEVLSQAAARVAGLQQAVGRAQARMARELELFTQATASAAASAVEQLALPTKQPPAGVAITGTYDATGTASSRLRTAGTYA